MHGRRWLPSLIMCGAVLIGTYVLYRANPVILQQVERRIVDARFRARGPLPPPPAIVLVAIDPKSIHEVGKWPWPRDRIAQLVERIAQAEPALVGLDFLFSEQSWATEGDRRLVEAVHRLKAVVLPCFFYLAPSYADYQTDAEYRGSLERIRAARFQVVENLQGRFSDFGAPLAYAADANIAELTKSAKAIGFFNILLAQEGEIQRVPCVIKARDGSAYMSFSLAVFRAFTGAKVGKLVLNGRAVAGVALDDRFIPTDGQGALPVNFYGPQSIFPTYSAIDIARGAFDPAALRGKIVLVGGTSILDFDTAVCPFTPTLPSIGLHANVLSNLISGTYLDAGGVAALVTLLLIALCAVVLCALLTVSENAWLNLGGAVLLAAAVVVGGQRLFTRHLIQITTTYPLVAIVALYTLMSARRGIVQEARLRRLRAAVSEVGRNIGSLLESDRILDGLLDTVSGLLGAERAAVLLCVPGDASARVLTVSSLRGITTTEMEAPAFSPLKAVIEKVKDGGKGVVIPRTGAEIRAAARGAESGYVPARVLCVPLKAKNEVVGILYADASRRGGYFSWKELGVIESFASHAGIYLQNAQLYAIVKAAEQKAKDENIYLKQEIAKEHEYHNIVGKSPAIRKVFDLVTRAAKSEIAVLIQGETGTGKELIARAIHYQSARVERMFVAQNCAAIPGELLESELFGHVKGAFTGACATKKGLFEIADGGTIFLDEVGDMPLSIQSKLLRVLDNGTFRPLGATQEKKADVRIISATNRNMKEAVEKGAFREDLFYRINSFLITVPPLRERREDIPLLVSHFADKYAAKLSKQIPGFSRDAMELLLSYRYPGNIRELENEVERAMTLTPSGEVVKANALSENLLAGAPAALGKVRSEQGSSGTLQEIVRGVEKEAIARALAQCGGKKGEVARRLGLARPTLNVKMKDYGLE